MNRKRGERGYGERERGYEKMDGVREQIWREREREQIWRERERGYEEKGSG